ncbi:DMT family transporter [Fodinicola acaciae]|uniref:DMT family transporter n=1 Tax=Fodinicola acaciae TaxID=2681555 RepID=UPI0013D128B2|nr:DMT family transporter [Fodinicola acaciae]
MAEPKTGRDLIWLVALGAALWGTDALLRLPLAESLPATAIVVAEHLIVVVVLLPWMPAAVRAFRSMSAIERWCVVAIGAGSSALATWLFTLAFAGGDPLTPLVLQKLQPLIAILAARLFLGERIRGRFWLFAVPALAGTWLVAFADPLHIQLKGAQAALLAVGAAALWAAGTVLGRRVSVAYAPTTVTSLRYAFGLPASLVIALVVGGPVGLSVGFSVGHLWSDLLGLVGLALIPGLLALSLYYRGLSRTPAARATLAELAFPLTAAVIGVVFLHGQFTVSQWIGAALVVGSVTALGWHERSSAKPAVSPEPARELVG